MFGKFMNNFYYGKSGKGDFTKDDMPETRWQLFWQMLRVRFAALVRLNLIYFVAWLPAVIVMVYFSTMALSVLSMDPAGLNQAAVVETMDGTVQEVAGPIAETGEIRELTGDDIQVIRQNLYNVAFLGLLILWPCVAVTGPATAGVCYVTRNWSRDEHAFIWSDFKDAVKANWKRSLVFSTITGGLPFLVFVGWNFYGQMAKEQTLMMVPQVLLLLLAIIWSISVTYMHPFNVSYDLGVTGQVRNGLLLGVARLPFSVGIRLLHCVPLLIAAVALYLTSSPLVIFLVVAYYLMIGFSLSRFVTASYTNAVFDKYINSRIEGAKVNAGLREQDDDDDEEEDEEKEQN